MDDDLQLILNRLEKWLQKHRAHYWKMLLPGASRAELDFLRKSIAPPLPEELRTLLAWHNGQSADFIGGFEANWQLMSTRTIAVETMLLLDPEAQSGWERSWIPFLNDDAGNYVCIDASQAGFPLRVD